MKKIVLMACMVFFVFTLQACNGNDLNDRNDGNNDHDIDLRSFTLDELSEYDGKEDRDAYIAVDGYVYDVSDSAHWTDGIHQGKIEAGQDLTEEIDTISPHGRSVLDNVPRIGVLIEDNQAEE